MCLLLCHRLYLKSSEFLLASQATNFGCLVVLACCTTASISASFLGVHPSECQMYTAKTRIPPVTFTHGRFFVHFLGWTGPIRFPCRSMLPSSCRLLQKKPPDVCLRSSLPALSSVILAASAAHLHPFVDSLMNCSYIPTLLILCSMPKNMSNVLLYLLCTTQEPFHKVHRFGQLLHLTPACSFFLVPEKFMLSSFSF